MKKLYGVTTAMVTPMDENEKVDLQAVRELSEFLIQKGVNCLYPLGTTGEMVRLSTQERKSIAQAVVEQAAGRCTVFVHCGGISQNETIELVQHAEKIGADGVGVVTPIYLGVNDREMETFYVNVAKSVSDNFPVYLYNIPQCAANDLHTEVIEKVVSRCKNVVGIKYSFADMIRTIDYLRVNGGNFSVLHGCDSLFLPALTMGCEGTVSGISGVYPEPFVALYKAWLNGNIKEAMRQQNIAINFIRALRGGANMAYFKTALEHRGIKAGHMRAPQLDLLPEEKSALVALLNKYEEDLK
jgi:4-hydroxy-tetrahydrodipicolinate synthase